MNKYLQLAFGEALVLAVFICLGLFCNDHFDASLAQRNLSPYLISMKSYMTHSFLIWTAVSAIALLLIPVLAFTRRTAESTFASSKTERVALVMLAVAVFYVVLTRCWQFPVASDDSFIDYRYVLNLVRLGTFDYNPGLHVMGFTSHLHLLVLASLCSIFHTLDVPVVSQQLNIFCQLVSCGLIYHLLSKVLNPLCGALGCFLFAADSYLITEVAYGKESSIVILLMVASIICLVEQRKGLFAWCNSLLFMARPEGIAWMAVAFCWHAKKLRVGAIKYWLTPGFLIGCWYAFLFLYFHTIMPHGALAKSKVYIPRPWFITPIELGAFIANPFLPLKTAPEGHPLTSYNIIHALQGMQFFWSFFAGGLVLLVIFRLSRKNPWLRFYWTAVASVFSFFCLTNPWMFSWYYSWFALIPILVVPVLINWFTKGKTAFRKGMGFALAAWFLYVPFCQQPQHFKIAGLPILIWETPEARLMPYREAALYLNNLESTKFDNDKLEKGKASEAAVYEPGIFGYFYKGRVLDLDGLVSDEPLKYYPLKKSELAPRSVAGIPPAAIENLHPPQVLFFNWVGFALFNDPKFLTRYKLVKEWPVNVDAAKFLYLYEAIRPNDSDRSAAKASAKTSDNASDKAGKTASENASNNANDKPSNKPVDHASAK